MATNSRKRFRKPHERLFGCCSGSKLATLMLEEVLMHDLVHVSIEIRVSRRNQVILMSTKRVENPYYLFLLNGHVEPNFGEIVMTQHQPYRVKLPSTTSKTHLL